MLPLHIVPLSHQPIAILKQIQEITGHLELVFPGDYNPYKTMNEYTTNWALRMYIKRNCLRYAVVIGLSL
ncbi:hypothetical protein JM656_13365 [Citrobacter sp. R56]|nr:hypothetical protein JM656_13365 [Citrobacter sp. R56]